jgi:hypothetical protein
MKPSIGITPIGEQFLILETRTHILDDCRLFSRDHTGARIIVRADSNLCDINIYYLDMSIMDDDDFDYTVEFLCQDKSEFIYKLELLMDWMNDIRGQSIFYDELLDSLPICS